MEHPISAGPLGDHLFCGMTYRNGLPLPNPFVTLPASRLPPPMPAGPLLCRLSLSLPATVCVRLPQVSCFLAHRCQLAEEKGRREPTVGMRGWNAPFACSGNFLEYTLGTPPSRNGTKLFTGLLQQTFKEGTGRNKKQTLWKWTYSHVSCVSSHFWPFTKAN